MSDVDEDVTVEPEPGPVDPPADDSGDEVDPEEFSDRKSISTIVDEVVAGQWGRGLTRRTRLSEAGYDVNDVLARVRERTVR